VSLRRPKSSQRKAGETPQRFKRRGPSAENSALTLACRQWLDLVTKSGTALFISAEPRTVTGEEKKMLKTALAAAARVQPEAEPLDWMETMPPKRWSLESETASFDWFGEEGANPLSKLD
jgi:hypothetical protein